MSDDKKPAEEKPADTTPTPAPDYEKKVVELEKKLGEVSSYLTEADAYIKNSSVVIDVLDKSPDLKSAFQSHLKKLYGEGDGEQPPQGATPPATTTVPKTQTPQNDRRIDEVAATQLKTIISDFERDSGISSLPEGEQKEAKQKIEAYMNTFGASVKTTPLSYLKDSLQKAYVGVTADKMREEGRLEGFAQARANQNGVMGSFSGTAPRSGEDKKVISDKQAQWLKKLHVDPDKAKKVMTQDEQEREHPAEKK